jgi:hypothetical protein
MAKLAHVIGVATLLLTTSGVQARSFDGTYTGTIQCGVLSNLSRPLKTAFAMTVAGDTVTYERQIVRPTGPTGSYERGSGTVTPTGDVALRGRGEGSFVFDSEYRGRLGDGTARLTGTQRWDLRGKPETRPCEIELTPPPGS